MDKTKNDKKPNIPQSFYFYLLLRFLAALFVIIALLFSASAVSILFIWDVTTTTIVKKCIFTLIYTLSVLIAAVMFLIANDGCDPRIISQFGCYQSVSTGTFQVASAFCFLILVFGLLDLGLNGFYLWRNSKRSPIYDFPPPSVAVVGTEKSIHDIYMEYHRKGQTTSV
ncbi:hypothetical protein CAEBREN_18406 [Caenorhabditis brenneri]|uniref:MARVEL domain-containing protein n=1 Tax=Caenorhabditis brenneri TaxID=135651 RepID=G0NT56_CAEBE|nr:hypothetical protein CAEBREN_18406 [Caenorhabditis brenneri]